MPCVGQSKDCSEDNLTRLVMESSLEESDFSDKIGFELKSWMINRAQIGPEDGSECEGSDSYPV